MTKGKQPMFRFCRNPNCEKRFEPNGEYNHYCNDCSEVSRFLLVKADIITKREINSYKKLKAKNSFGKNKKLQ